ncbi:hypothetical protein OH76DRAFT_862648 [Lentinus brumalis]|uniref:Uncharacterized protein n=1 Tax=Lentinus brumalis TaxID=2498619 RepID=A0A371DRD2_9APHY|nr:hypothetical protein OH76DRAFT_862648 [Polyporus brumalis]
MQHLQPAADYSRRACRGVRDIPVVSGSTVASPSRLRGPHTPVLTGLPILVARDILLIIQRTPTSYCGPLEPCRATQPPTDEGTLKSPGLAPRVCSIYRGDTLERMSAPWTVPSSTKNIPSSERTGSIEQRMQPRDRRSLCFLSSPAASCCAGYARGPSPVPSRPSLLSLLDSRPPPAAVTGAHHRASQFSSLSLLVTLPALVLGVP